MASAADRRKLASGRHGDRPAPYGVDSDPVRKTVVLILVLVGLTWQAASVGGQGALLGAAQDLAHAVLHWQETGHHHEEDGAYHADDSDESARHVALDEALSAPALRSETLALAWMPPGLAPPVHRDAVPLPYVPDGPRRPPKLTL